MRTVVLGGGPVGLLAAYLMRADICLARDPGGDARLRALAPTYLWRTEATQRLLADLGILAVERTVLFGYLSEAGASLDVDDRGRAEYYRRSRSLPAGAEVVVPDSAMSSGRAGAIDTYDLSVDDVVNALLMRVSVHRCAVLGVQIVEREQGRLRPKVRVAVDGTESYLASGPQHINASNLVNTLPAPVYDGLVIPFDGSRDRPAVRTWEAYAKAFVKLPLSACPADLRLAYRSMDLAYLYVVSEDRRRHPYDRVAFRGDDAVLEFNAETMDEVLELACGFGEPVASGRWQVRGAARDPVEHAGTVRHIGRLARWSHAVRLHDVVEEVYRDVDDATA